MKKLILPLLFCVSAAYAETSSVYTDTTTDCVTVSSPTDEAPIDFLDEECKSFGGYRLRHAGGDLRYAPRISYNGKDIELIHPPSFHDMASTKIEWVYDLKRDYEGAGKINFKALIYRLSANQSEDPYADPTVLLYVVRLNGKNSCSIGTRKTNEEARKLANDANAKCVTHEF